MGDAQTAAAASLPTRLARGCCVSHHSSHAPQQVSVRIVVGEVLNGLPGDEARQGLDGGLQRAVRAGSGMSLGGVRRTMQIGAST